MTSLPIAAVGARRASISRRAAILLVATILAAAGCGGGSDSPTAPKNNDNNNTTTDPKGLYDLRMIDNAVLPGEIYHGPYFDPKTTRFYNQMVLLVTRGSVNIIANNRWAMTLDMKQTLDGKEGQTTFYADGTYEVQGNDILFKPETDNLSELTGTLDRGTISFSLAFNGSRERAFNFRR